MHTNINKSNKSCINFSKIEDPNDLIKYTITKSNFNGLVITGPSLKNNFKYMHIFANKIVNMDGVTYLNINNYLKLNDSKLKEWIKSNFELFLDYYVNDKKFISNNKKFKIPVSVDYGKGISKKIFTTGKKFEITSRISDLNEIPKDKITTKQTIESWASKGSKKKFKSKDLYSNYRKSLQDGYQGITGRVIKSILINLYKDYYNREFKLTDYNKLVGYIRFNKTGGGLISERNIAKILEIKHNMEKTVENNISQFHFNNYYIFLKKLYS